MITVILFISHFVADFVFQSRKMGENKSTDFGWLFKHVGVYAIVLAILTYPLFLHWGSFLLWVIANFFFHLITDAITSRLSGYFYMKKNMKGFWNVIGIDQMIHYLTLLYTFEIING